MILKIFKTITNFFNKNKMIPLDNGLFLKVDNSMLWAFENGRYYEYELEAFLLDYLTKMEDVIFYDIGANNGYYTVKFNKLFKRTIAFEPNTTLVNLINHNLKINNIFNSHVFNLALSDAKAELPFYFYSSTGNNSLFKRKLPIGHNLKLKYVKNILVNRLDAIIVEHSLTAPTVMKIDVEGAELSVLRGASETLSNSRPDLIIEMSNETFGDAGYNCNDLVDFLKDYGYKFYDLKMNPLLFDMDHLIIYSGNVFCTIK
jgi:FkbM family methyltransferase